MALSGKEKKKKELDRYLSCDRSAEEVASAILVDYLNIYLQCTLVAMRANSIPGCVTPLLGGCIWNTVSSFAPPVRQNNEQTGDTPTGSHEDGQGEGAREAEEVLFV